MFKLGIYSFLKSAPRTGSNFFVSRNTRVSATLNVVKYPPFSQPRTPLSFRTYATHREIYSRLSTRQSYQSGWDRWKGPFLFAAGVVVFNYFALPHIMDLPFMTPLRRNPEMVVYGILALNAVGFLAWRLPGAPQQFMMKYGLLQKAVPYFRAPQMLGMAFSHQNFMHIAINMFVLYQFGVPIARWMGATGFLECYLDSCVLSSLGSMLAPALLGRAVLIPSLGASGAVFACVGVFSYLLPNAAIALWFIPLPIGAWNVFLLTMGYNAFAMVSKRGVAFSGSGIDYAGHVFGSLCGIFFGWLTQKKIRARAQRTRRVGFW